MKIEKYSKRQVSRLKAEMTVTYYNQSSDPCGHLQYWRGYLDALYKKNFLTTKDFYALWQHLEQLL